MFEAAEKAKIIRIMTGLRVTAFRGEIRSQRIRRGAALWVGLLLTLALTACAGEPGSSVDQVTLTPTATALPAPLPTRASTPTPEVVAQVAVWTAWDPVELQALRDVIGLFTQQHPEIEISLAYYPQNRLLETYLTCLSSGGCPAILFGPSEWGPLLVQQDGVVDVSAFIDPQLQNDLYSVAWSQVAFGDVMTGIPLELQGRVLYRNSNLVPERSSQLSGLIRDAITLRDDSKQPSVFDFGFYNSVPFLAACEGSLFSPDGELAISGQPALCWLDALQRWGSAGRVVINTDEDRTAFEAGQSGWLMDSSLLLPTLTRELGAGALTVDPWPVLTETGEPLKGYVWAENVYLSSRLDTDTLEASWTFARFLFDSTSQAILSDPAGAAHIPAQESVTISDPLMQTVSAMLRSGVPLPLRVDLGRFIPPINNLVDSVVIKRADPQQALNVLQTQVRASVPTATPTPTASAGSGG
jgi:ABC-type glycerol-3-phosphate transport system substrate-binding protein